jgi:hypothetical protein
MNIIGLGRAGCSIVEEFAQFPQYKTYKIDTNLAGEKRAISLPVLDSPEEYESLELKMGNFLRGMTGEALFILSGASRVSGVALRVLENIHKKGVNITILYIHPEVELLGEQKQLQERVVRNVLQQYSRSGLLKRMYLVDNRVLEQVIGEVPIYEYYNRLNSFLVNVIHILNVFQNSESVTDTFSTQAETARICTFGAVEPDGTEVLFYPLSEIREIKYYFGVPVESLKTQNSLYRKIVDMVKSKISGRLKASYGIYETSYDDMLTYGIYYSSEIQEKNTK